MSLGGGGFHVSFPLKAGDLGWILASDRDISLFKQSLLSSAPNTGRLHSFEDGWFIPDVFRKYTINPDNVESDQMVIQSVDGETCVAIGPKSINITAPNGMFINAESSIQGSLDVSGNVTVGNGASGTFTSLDGLTITVQDGIVTNIF
jgi:hypothetical protein